MDDSQSPGEYRPAGENNEIRPGLPGRRRFQKRWLLVLPLLGWLCCLGAALYLFFPLNRAAAPISIPDTGGQPVATRAARQAAPVKISPTKAAPPVDTPTPGSPANADTYLGEAQQRLDDCAASFHEYFAIQQVALDRPEVLNNDVWRADVTDAMRAFRQDCQLLGSLPTAPPAYAKIDHWLKLAAGEVAPATDSFTSALDQNQYDQFQVGLDHLKKFIDYIQNAEDALNAIKELKQI